LGPLRRILLSTLDFATFPPDLKLMALTFVKIPLLSKFFSNTKTSNTNACTFRSLAALLRRSSLEHADQRVGYFWSTKLLSQIITNDIIIEALDNECRLTSVDLQSLAKKIQEVICQPLNYGTSLGKLTLV
jgi:hypothetical protein